MMQKTKLLALVPAVGLTLLLAAGGAVTGPVASLLGSSPATVIEKFGVPDEVTMGGGGVTFRYRGKTPEMQDFVFHGGVAIAVPAPDFQPAKVLPPPADRAFNGQAAGPAARRLGNPVAVFHGGNSIEARYESGAKALFAQGLVSVK